MQVVPVDVMKKPDVVDVYNGGMNGVKNKRIFLLQWI